MSHKSRSEALFTLDSRLTVLVWIAAVVAVALAVGGEIVAAIWCGLIFAALRGIRSLLRGVFDTSFDLASKASTARGISGRWDADKVASLRLRRRG